eukprot:TRINITY_DN15796_c0_g1_i2.p1 TRINITY_DN15796_c0_g1~~TRINITY_DN15796_c0_g1_i2.p1  ORF type:complete len:139 (-),score=23.00 TRINITY_DN15796_c0_g1_i2:407-823(-)
MYESFLEPGSAVEFCGLQSRPKLNGTVGRIVASEDADGFVTVLVPKSTGGRHTISQELLATRKMKIRSSALRESASSPSLPSSGRSVVSQRSSSSSMATDDMPEPARSQYLLDKWKLEKSMVNMANVCIRSGMLRSSA